MVKKPPKKSGAGASAPKVGDARFANFQTDERFRLPSKKLGKTKIDSRFSRMLKDDQFTKAATVDRYGRKVQADAKKKALQNLYDASDNDDDDDDSDSDDKGDRPGGREPKNPKVKYDPARGGGFSSSESDDNDSDEDSDEDEEGAQVEAASSMQRLRDEEADVETGEVTRRLAVVNMDWDHVKSTDLMALFSSFVPEGSKIESVSVYPSEFGKERIQREELEGPPRDIFKTSSKSDDEGSDDNDSGADDSDEDEDDKIKHDLIEEGDADDFNSDALRKYQLDRLRYYYAVVVCDKEAGAESIYKATDGTEYQTSSNFLDLRFVPDDVTFDDEPRDKCTSIPASYRPTEYITDALQHSKVKLTWDMHPEETTRKEDIKRAFSGSHAELQENDLRAYLASDSEDSDAGGDDHEQPGGDAGEPKLSKKELARKKMREALGLGTDSSAKSSKAEATGEMEMTFALDEHDNKNSKQKPEQEETTVEKYIRKERERKAKKKEKAMSKRDGTEAAETAPVEMGEQTNDLGFDDPFFTTDEPVKATKNTQKKEERLKKRAAKDAEAAEDAAEKARLEKLLADDRKDAAGHLGHFNISEIARAEKQKAKKGKKSKQKGGEDRGGLQEGFHLDVTDDRFKKLFDNHEFAIDPSDPKFQATPGMKTLLEERRKRTSGEDASGRSGKKARKQ